MQRLVTPLLLIASVVLLAGVAVAGISLVGAGPDDAPSDADAPESAQEEPASGDAAEAPDEDGDDAPGEDGDEEPPESSGDDEPVATSPDDAASDGADTTEPGDGPGAEGVGDGGEEPRDGDRDRTSSSADAGDVDPSPERADPEEPETGRQGMATGDTAQTHPAKGDGDQVVATLPHTGGPPAALLGLLTLASAAGLRRRTGTAWQ